MGKLAIFGGTFDPIHLGHLIIAQDIFEELKLDELRFMPAAHAPMKDQAASASGEDRLAMIRMAIDKHAGFTVDDRELKTGGVNYTIDTVNAILEESPDMELSWIIGSDHLATLADWRKIETLASQIQFICADRPTEGKHAGQLPKGVRLIHIQTHSIEISSSEIRKRLHSALPVDLFLPASVHEYILKHQLYE